MNIFSLLKNDFCLADEKELKEIKSLAIGCFDALHLAHFELINKLCSKGALLIIYKDNIKQLVPNFMKEKIAKKKVFFIKLNEVCNLDGKDFVQKLLASFSNLEYFVAGYDFCFGINASSNVYKLEEYSKLKCHIVNEFKIDNLSVHTTLIKELLQKAQLNLSKKLLGRNYTLYALKQIKGQGLGSKFLLATINFDYDEYFLPKDGVYLANLYIKNTVYKSAVFLGKRSTDLKSALECHILDEIKTNDFSNCNIEFLYYLRENKSFNQLEKLKEQILLDVKTLNEIKEKF